MGFFDRAKNQIQDKIRDLSEETVRVMDTDDEQPRDAKKKSEPKKKLVKQQPVKQAAEPAKSLRERFKNNSIVSRPKSEPESVEEEVDEEPEVSPIVYDDEEDSAFDTSDDNETREFMDSMTSKFKKKMKSYEAVPVPTIDEGKVQDILEILQIPATFEIDNDIYMPEDLKNIGFDIQVPQGYDIGQIDTFVSRVSVTVDKYVKLLSDRNEHVAKLATVVDRLQVDLSNVKLQSEIANGINIMTTNDDEDYEQENMELKLIIKRLEEQLQNHDNDVLSSEERDTFDKLQDELSVKERELKDREDEIYELKNQLALREEEGDDYVDTTLSDDSGAAFVFEDDEDELSTPFMEPAETPLPESPYGSEDELYYEDEYDNNSVSSGHNNEYVENDELPDFGTDDSDELPNFDDYSTNIKPLIQNDSSVTSVSAFAFDEDEEDEFDRFMKDKQEGSYMNDSNIELVDDNGHLQRASQVGTFYDPDEDDSLDQLERWSKEQ